MMSHAHWLFNKEWKSFSTSKHNFCWMGVVELSSSWVEKSNIYVTILGEILKVQIFSCDFRKASTQNYISLASFRSSPLFPKYISNPITTLCFVNTQNDKLIQKLAGAAPYKMKFSPANAFDPKKPEHENSLHVPKVGHPLCMYPFRTWTWCDFLPSYGNPCYLKYTR